MKILFLSPDSYSVFHPETAFIFGGAEIETGYHAAGLVKRKFEVAVVTRDHAVPSHAVNGVILYPHPELKGAGYWDWRKSIQGRLTFKIKGDKNPYKDVESLYKSIDPDFAYVMGMSPEALHLSAYCAQNGIRFIFRVAHDLDLGGSAPSDTVLKNWANVGMEDVHQVLKRAHLVLAQTPFQQQLLQQNFSRTSELMFPPIDLNTIEKEQEKKYDVLWIGKNNSFKRPEELAKLAQSLPHRKFCMILNKMEELSWQAIVKALPSNVEVIESVPTNRIEEYFRKAKLFVSTSLHEGFPNTFLQAAKHAVPVISMGSDPNNMLTVHFGGSLAGDDPVRLVNEVEHYLKNEPTLLEKGLNAFAFVKKYHDREKISDQLEHLLNS